MGADPKLGTLADAPLERIRANQGRISSPAEGCAVVAIKEHADKQLGITNNYLAGCVALTEIDSRV
jgi:hypothetical protein